MFIYFWGIGRVLYKGDIWGEKGVIFMGLLKLLLIINYRIYFINENLCFNIIVFILKGFFFYIIIYVFYRCCK